MDGRQTFQSLPGVCRVIDGAIIIFEIEGIEKYLK
jgi:hypothetical protein